MSKSVWKSSTSCCRQFLSWWAVIIAFAATLGVVGSSGCATVKVPPVMTYEQAKKEVGARGSLVSGPIEKREGYSEGKSSVVKKGDLAPHAGIVIDADKARYYVAIKAERDRRRKELEAARQNLEIRKLINKSALEHIEAKVRARNTWWERNKGLMGLAVGVTIGIGLVVGVLYAVTKGDGMQTSSNAHIMRW